MLMIGLSVLGLVLLSLFSLLRLDGINRESIRSKLKTGEEGGILRTFPIIHGLTGFPIHRLCDMHAYQSGNKYNQIDLTGNSLYE